MTTHWFWLILTTACIGWYAVMTFYVAIRGVSDIAHLLERFKSLEPTQSDAQE
mgnify:CR=1 FL=1